MLPSVLSTSLRRRLFFLLVFSGLMLSVALAGLFLIVRESAAIGEARERAYLLLAGFLALVILAVGRFIERYGAEVLAQDYVQQLRQMVLAHSLNLPARHNERINSGGTLLRLTGDMGAVRNWIVQGEAPAVVLGTWLIASVIALAFLHWSLAGAVILPLMFSAGVNYALGRNLYRLSVKARQKRTRMIRNVAEKLAAVEVIRSFNQQGKEQRRFERQGARLRLVLTRRAFTSGLLRGCNEAMLLLTLLALVFTGQLLVSRTLITASDFSLMLIAAIYLLANLRRLSRVYELWTLNRVAIDKLERFFSLEAKLDGTQSGSKRRFRGVLALIAAGVDGRLCPVTASLGVHDRVSLDGVGGSGKSTLLRLMAGLEPAYQGRLEYGGISLKCADPGVWSKQVALVSNDLPLLSGTVRSNLLYGRRRYDENYYREVLALCGLEQAVKAELKPSAAVVAAGANLSSSDCYRLMLARALLRRPQYLLIDCHEAHLDTAILNTLSHLLRWFPGGVLVCTNQAVLQKQCNQHWQLSSAGQFCASASPNGVGSHHMGKFYAV